MLHPLTWSEGKGNADGRMDRQSFGPGILLEAEIPPERDNSGQEY